MNAITDVQQRSLPDASNQNDAADFKASLDSSQEKGIVPTLVGIGAAATLIGALRYNARNDTALRGVGFEDGDVAFISKPTQIRVLDGDSERTVNLNKGDFIVEENGRDNIAIIRQANLSLDPSLWIVERYRAP